ncbi:MAG: 50S ribosomal protein L11 methyltransferase [Chitinophagaceae bacterium]
MNSIQITIEANQYQQEELIALLSDYDPLGFEEKENELIAFFEEKKISDEIKQIIHGYTYTIEIIEERNWNEEWEKNFQPVIVGNFAGVRAHFHQLLKSVENEIIITPKMSFGTGHHATTYMMMEQMQNIDFAAKTVFDFGTGTGILSILAEKLGAKDIIAIDIDDWSIKNAQENIQRNNCSKIKVSLSSMIPTQQFDIILANINRNAILQYLSELKQTIIPNGYILLSGLLTTDEQDIVKACTHLELQLFKKTERNNWISLLFRNQ